MGTDIHLSQKSYDDMTIRIQRLENSLERQTENMAFVLERSRLPEKLVEKFESELAEDRQTLTGRN